MLLAGIALIRQTEKLRQQQNGLTALTGMKS